MKKLSVIALVVISASTLAFGFTQGFQGIKEFLTGYEEVPSVSTTGNGVFDARINKAGDEVAYTLTLFGSGGSRSASSYPFWSGWS